jgi:MFS transporter, DHA1 family, multidrug resistance protein
LIVPSVSPNQPPLPLPFLVAINAVPSISTNILLPSMPGLVVIFRTDVATIYLALSLYLVGLAIGQLAYGPLSDRFGRRPLLLIGMAIYAAGSVLCTLAVDVPSFLAGRVLQALGGCAGLVLGRVMVRDVHESGKAASVIGYMVMITTLGTGVAPLIGSVLDENFGWRAVFVFCSVTGALVLALCVRWAPETRQVRVALSSGPSLVRSYPRLLSMRPFVRCALYASFLYASYAAFFAGAPIIMIDLWGYSQISFAAWWSVGSASYLFGNFLAGRFSVDLKVERMMAIGTPLLALSAVLLIGLLAAGVDHPFSIFVPIGLSFIGTGIAQPSAISTAIGADPEIGGAASALLGFMQIAFGAIAITLVGVLPQTAIAFALVSGGALVLAVLADRGLHGRAQPAQTR